MKRMTLATLAFIGLSILACSGGSEEEAADGTEEATDEGAGDEGEEEEDLSAEDIPEVQITEPWFSMALPINDGSVALSDNTILLVAYEGATITNLANSWAPAIEKAGWVKDWDGSDPSMTVIVYKKAGTNQQVGLAIGTDDDAPGFTFVYMEDLDKVPEEKSTVRQKRSGKLVKIHTNHAATHKSTGGKKKGGHKKGGKGKGGKGKGKH